MARPQRNNVDYFPFYCEDGKKMFYLEETYGNDGFATFVKLLRELAKTDFHYLDLSKNTTTMFLSARCKVSKETLEAIINDLVELEKFDSVLWSENRIVWCQDFVDSIQDAYSKRSNECITYEGLLLLLQGLGVRKPIKQPSTVPVKPQSIVEYTKPNNTKEIRELTFREQVAQHTTFESSMLDSFADYWTESNEKGVKLRFEMQKTFDIGRRLKKWSSNNFGGQDKTEVTDFKNVEYP